MTNPLVPTRYPWAVADADGDVGLADARLTLGGPMFPGSGLVRRRGGFFPGPGTPAEVLAATPTPNGTISVGPFSGVLNPTRSAAPYLIAMDSTTVWNVFGMVGGAPSASANRRDLVIYQLNDTSMSDATNAANLRYVIGNAPAADPAITGSTDYIVIAQVTVRQNATSILQSDIVSRLPAGYVTVAAGGTLPVPSQAVRDAIAAPYAGMRVFREDRGWAEVYRSGAWRVEGVATVATVAALSSDITGPYSGQLAFVTGASAGIYRYTGAAWALYSTVDGPRGLIAGRQITGSNNLGAAIGASEGNPTSMSTPAFDVVGGRALGVFARYKSVPSINSDGFLLRLRIGAAAGTAGTVIHEREQFVFTPNQNNGMSGYMSALYLPAADAAAQIISFTAVRFSGAGTVQFVGGGTGATNPVGVEVWDLGVTSKITVTAS